MKLATLSYLIFLLLLQVSINQEKKKRKRQGVSNAYKTSPDGQLFGDDKPIEDNTKIPKDVQNSKDNHAKPQISPESIRGCPTSKHQAKYAVYSFWNHQYLNAYYCSIDVYKSSKLDKLTQAIGYVTSQIDIVRPYANKDIIVSLPTTVSSTILSQWEILGPFPIGKLEVDGDPIFDSLYNKYTATIQSSSYDICAYILSMNSFNLKSNSISTSSTTTTTTTTGLKNNDIDYSLLYNNHYQIHSELQSHTDITWKSYSLNPTTNQIDVTFPQTEWQKIYQSLSTQSSLEFQGWARTTTYVKISGVYIIHCLGVHTVYIRNDNITRFVSGDIYRNPDSTLTSTVELKAGLVGIVIPLRGVVHLSYTCTLLSANEYHQLKYPIHDTSVKPSIHVLSVTNLPHIVQLDSLKVLHSNKRTTSPKFDPSQGLLLSPYFSLNIQNIDVNSISIEIQLDTSKQKADYKLGIRPLRHSGYGYTKSSSQHFSFRTDDGSILLSPGQVAQVPLELYNTSISSTTTTTTTTSITESSLIFTCPKSSSSSSSTSTSSFFTSNSMYPLPKFTLLIHPSRGSIIQQDIQLECRKASQSFLMSYIDHDNSVSQAGVLFPLPVKSTLTGSTSENIKSSSSTSSSKKDIVEVCHSSNHINSISSTPNTSAGTCINYNITTLSTSKYNHTFPYILSLHGTGLSPLSQADAYKVMYSTHKEYTFGVVGYYVITPGRFGAHNWEMVGDLSARTSIEAIRFQLSKYPFLPQLSIYPGIVMGHSMGGHGAWIVSMNTPDLAVCTLPTAGWIRKEEYGTSNAFFDLDIQNAYVALGMKGVLEMSMSEFHVDRLAPINLHTQDVHIRVGSADMSTPPWYSRRMHRLLTIHGVNSTLEEVSGKEHWWWDTTTPNDGGALNDLIMRQFYESCRIKHDIILHDALTNNVLPHNTINGTSTNNTQGITEEVNTSSHTLSNTHYYCKRDIYRIHAVNLGTHSGTCGIQILQQFMTLQDSTVYIHCYDLTALTYEQIQQHIAIEDAMHMSLLQQGIQKLCHVTVGNVRRLRVQNDYLVHTNVAFYTSYQVLYPLTSSKLKSTHGNTDVYAQNIDICWSDDIPSSVSLCTNASIDPIRERVPLTYGPIRHIYTNPFTIVYGTPNNQRLRLVYKDLATYLANSHLAASATNVHVLSDVQYRGNQLLYDDHLDNIILIGGPTTNKILGKYCTSSSSYSDNDTTYITMTNKYDHQSYDISITCHSPVLFHSTVRSSTSTTTTTTAADRRKKSIDGFSIGSYTFNKNEILIYTMPLVRRIYRTITTTTASPTTTSTTTTSTTTNTSADKLYRYLVKEDIAYVMCIYASTVDGYLSLSRLAWPTVPPMVRAPFTNYLPDIIIMDETFIWTQGLGATRMSGYWNVTWQLDLSSVYIHPTIRYIQ